MKSLSVVLCLIVIVPAAFSDPVLTDVTLSHVRTYATTNTGSNALGDKAINSLYIDNAGTVYIGTNGGGLSVFDGKNWTTHTTSDGLVNNFITDIHVNTAGTIYVGTEGGVGVYDGADWTAYTEADGLAYNDAVSYTHLTLPTN